jgi:SEC-C motif domain protein
VSCPCGAGPSYDRCCGPLHDGAPAPTAEALMRSRYSAFAVGRADHLFRSWHPRTRPDEVVLPQGTT